MKRVAIISLTLIFGLCLATGAFAVDKDAIKKQVDDIVVAIDDSDLACTKIDCFVSLFDGRFYRIY